MAVTINDGSLQWVAGIDTTPLKKQVAEVQNAITGIQKKAEDQADAIDRLARRAAAGVTAYLSVQAASGFISQMVRVRGEFQQLEVAFRTMLGSKERADKLLAQVTEFAATTPYGLDEVAKATKQLLAFGIQAEDIQKTLRQLGDVAAGIGAPIGDIAYLYGTIRTQGKAMTVDVRQFANRGIPIYEELAKVLRVNVEEVGNLIEAGKVGFPEIQKVFESLTAEGSKFGGLMEAQSKTLTGQISNLQDAVTQMFNELGKGSEGAISTAISGLAYLVENYEKVLDVIKLLIAAYGSYKAAIIVSNAAMAVSTSLAKGYTVAELLRYRAMLLSEKAMAALNATFLKNPIATVVAGITTLIAAFVLFRKEASRTEKIEKTLSDVRVAAAASVSKEKEELESLLSTAKNEKVSKESRLKAIKKLNELSPEYLGNLNLENINTNKAREAVDKYIDSLEKLALTKAIENKMVGLSEELVDAEIKFREAQEKARAFAKANPNASEGAILTYSGVQSAKKSRDAINDQIEGLRDLQEQQLLNQKTAGVNTNKEVATGNKLQSSLNSILEKRLDILQRIADIERDAAQTGLTDQERAIDEINQKYDLQLQAIKDINRQIERFNKQNPGSNISLLGQDEIDRLEAARALEQSNMRYRADAANYIESVRVKQQAFEALKKAQETGETVIIESAQKTYEKETKGFKSYLEFLEDEFNSLFDTLAFDGTDDIGSKTRIEELLKLIQDERAKLQAEEKQISEAEFNEALDRLESYGRKRFKIIKDYNDAESALESRKNLFSAEEYAALQEKNISIRDRALNDLENQAARESDIMLRLSEDVIRWTQKQIQTEIELLEKLLQKNKELTPEIRKQVEARIGELKALTSSTNQVQQKAEQTAQDFAAISNSLSGLADLTDGLNDGLSEVLQTLADITSVAAQAATTIAEFAAAASTGNYAQAAAAAVDLITGIFSIGKRNREARRRAQAEIQAFQDQVLAGEVDLNQLYRQRLLEQSKLNKLRIDGVIAERQQLQKNAELARQDYERIFELIQGESYITGKTTRRNGKRVVDELASLSGMNYDQLEKLFLEGRLTDRARELFETLQKLKQEGLDIDKALEESRQRLKALFTGTTSDSIASSILEGFKAGKRGAADFASDFQSLMEQALLQSLSYRALEGPLNTFFDQFAADAESGNRLDAGEIERLQSAYNAIINNASEQFAQLQDIAGLSFGSSVSAGQNTLAGAIKGITEQQADLLAGQFGGLRITAAEHLNVAKAQLDTLSRIEINTYRLHAIYDLWKRIERDGIKVI